MKFKNYNEFIKILKSKLLQQDFNVHEKYFIIVKCNFQITMRRFYL
jgi:hypothetical protein